MNHKADRTPRAAIAALRAGLRPLTLVFIAGCVMAGATWAAIKPEDFSGRWALRDGYCGGGACKALFDISACGERWCGVEVEEGGKCGQTSMQLVAEKASNSKETVLSGQFRPAKDAEPYAISASISISENGARTLWIYGNTGGKFQEFRRTYPLEMSLARSGEPQCRGTLETS